MFDVDILEVLDGDAGFFDRLVLDSNEYNIIYQIIYKHWASRIIALYPNCSSVVNNITLDKYHTLNDAVDHKKLWDKESRLFSDKEVEEVRGMRFFKELEGQFGQFQIANEEKLRKEEIYWRIARPNSYQDVGPLHADSWYWELGHGEKKDHQRRVKIWIPICCDKGLNGLRYIPGSHLQKEKYTYIPDFRDGLNKPFMDVSEDDLSIEPFHVVPGQAILFHDDLIHGGLVGGMSTRVSLEWTCLINS